MPIIDNSPPALTNPNATDKLNSPPHATQHANVNDEIEAISDTLIAGLVQEAAAVVRVSNTQFTVAGDVTAYYTIGRKLVTNHAGTPVAVTVSASSYSAPNTTVTVVGNNLPTPLNTVALSTEPKGNTQAKAEAIATDAVETAKIKDANVTTAKIADGAVTPAKTGAFDKCKVSRLVAQTLTSGSMTTINWTEEFLDTNAMHDNATNNSRITIKKAGTYLVGCLVAFAASTAGRRFCTLIKNGAAIETEISDNRAATSAGEGKASIVTVLADMAVNDYLEVQALQDSTADLNVEDRSSFFVVQLPEPKI